MSDLIVVLTVLTLYAAIVVSPGPNFALVSRLTLRREDRAAWGATLGLALAATFYGLLAMVGLSAL
jgi:threonine/homoserine/homoserine lactone efflux protein